MGDAFPCDCSSMVAADPIDTIDSDLLWACPGRCGDGCIGVHCCDVPLNRELLEGTVRDKVERCPREGTGGVNPLLFGLVLGLSRGDDCLDRSAIVWGCWCWLDNLDWLGPGAIFLKVM